MSGLPVGRPVDTLTAWCVTVNCIVVMKAHTGNAKQFISRNCTQRDVCGFHSPFKPMLSRELLTPVLDMLITEEIK
jgi:hypothetical protein